MNIPRCLDNDFQGSESPRSRETLGNLAHSPEDRVPTPPGAAEGDSIGKSVERQDSGNQVSGDLRNTSTANHFNLHLREWSGDSILVKNMSTSDTVHDLKMRIQDQNGTPLRMQRVFLAGEQLQDGTPAGMTACVRGHQY